MADSNVNSNATRARAALASYIQYTLVRPDATRAEMVLHVEQAAQYRFNAAMIPMCWAPLARDILRGTGVRVAAPLSFGLGNESLHGKIALVREALALGLDEVDYQPNMAFYLSGMFDAFYDEAVQLLKAAEHLVLKPMLELGYLATEDAQRHAARLLDEAGMPWIKNSSGTGPHLAPATPENIRLLRETVSPRCRVKASGGIKTYEQVLGLLDAGAELIGTSAGVSIVTGEAASGPNSY
ncbi:MAG: deoxyribose-phosphate aldolase [Anaerolineae bacterium]|nr:deoxyribose-phosphate aldolase [Anaerolineae bacterium]